MINWIVHLYVFFKALLWKIALITATIKKPLANREKHRSFKATVNIYSMSRRECMNAFCQSHAHIYIRKTRFASEKGEMRATGWLVRDGFSREKGKVTASSRARETKRVAMVTIKGADQTRRDEDTSFIADFVTQKPPPRNRRIRSLRATPPIHPLTLILSSSTRAESICGIETSSRKKKSDIVTLTWRLQQCTECSGIAEDLSSHNKNCTINFYLIKRRYYQLYIILFFKLNFQFWIS